ncbi:MAG: hypothetical protein Q4F34_06665 [Prevotellaceae bacterium]|nr:hypothetical protein [Prevotellaceae bacterium]
MKKLLFTLVALCATMSINAQVINVYENGVKKATYSNSSSKVYKVEYKRAPSKPDTTGEAYRKDNKKVAWVQLWEDGPKWATYNVGAENDQPEDYGGYYCWGSSINKDTAGSPYYRNGIAPLSGDDDTATAIWGDNWRMPTRDEMQALLDNCTYTWTTQNDVNGLLCTGNTTGYTDNSVFLPAAGYFYRLGYCQGEYCNYWFSTPYDSDGAYYLHSFVGISHDNRYFSYSVRAVLNEE